jgi:hypothetical protein
MLSPIIVASSTTMPPSVLLKTGVDISFYLFLVTFFRVGFGKS